MTNEYSPHYKNYSDKYNYRNQNFAKYNHIDNTHLDEKNTKDSIIEIFGIKLSFDQLLILGLLFILYLEKVDDLWLYIILLLLLFD